MNRELASIRRLERLARTESALRRIRLNVGRARCPACGWVVSDCVCICQRLHKKKHAPIPPPTPPPPPKDAR